LSETAEVLAAISDFGERGQKMALATIVGISGSTYRRPGARLLISETGEMVGNLSGGCLEGEVHQVAEQVMADSQARVAFYDLTADDEVVWGWGLGCNGAIEVFVEPAANALEIAAALRAAIEEQRLVGVATVLESTVDGVGQGDRLMVEPGGDVRGRLQNGDAHGEIVAGALEALASGITETQEVSVAGGQIRVFFESILPPLRLLVCGAGHDAIPVVRLAASLGWTVDVVDDRKSMLSSDRFPDARSFIETEPVAAAKSAGADDRTYVAVMSHNYLRDRDYLRSFLGSPAAYIGMLGPRARLQRLLDDLAGDGVSPTPDDLERLHGPAGLDVGADGPEEIAAAIVGEILAVGRERGGGFLRDRSGPIHARAVETSS
jgi:xanthine dehydrogenase accessory factor